MRQAGWVTDKLDAFSTLQADLRQFRDERDWARFHDPKSLVLALMGEVGELAELFQWVPADEAISQFATADRKARVAEEMSDVLIYLIGLAEVLDIDLLPAAQAKLADSRRRFPASSTHGVAPLES
jgi:NTP pyrophosphatase (non-canonical NTP hydrolase)